MKPAFSSSSIAVGLALFASTTPGLAAEPSEMMSICNTYAARHLGLSTSDIADLSYEGQRVDGTHAVNGQTTRGQTFQCSFNSAGTRVEHWYHSAPRGCPFDVSQADRYLYPDCD